MTPFDPAQYKNIERQAYSMTTENHEKYGSTTFQMCALPLLESTGLGLGQHVLDVACGPGIPSLVAAQLVTPGGTWNDRNSKCFENMGARNDCRRSA